MISDGEDAEVDDDLVGVDSRDNNDQEDEPEIDEEHFSINHVEVFFFCTDCPIYSLTPIRCVSKRCF